MHKAAGRRGSLAASEIGPEGFDHDQGSGIRDQLWASVMCMDLHIPGPLGSNVDQVCVGASRAKEAVGETRLDACEGKNVIVLGRRPAGFGEIVGEAVWRSSGGQTGGTGMLEW